MQNLITKIQHKGQVANPCFPFGRFEKKSTPSIIQLQETDQKIVKDMLKVQIESFMPISKVE
jgi:hypothetical protein